MLDIVPSCNPVQYQGKLLMQTLENVKKKLISDPILESHILFCDFYLYQQLYIVPNLRNWVENLIWIAWPKFGPPNFLCGVYLYQMLDNITSYHCMQFQEKRIIRSQENDKKPHFGPDLGPLDPNTDRQIVFKKMQLRQSLDIMVSYHHIKYQRKLRIPILRKLSDERTDRQTGTQTDESDLI